MRIATLAFVVGAAGVASANTSHHASGGGSSEAACIRWEPIPVDMAGADMASVDMALVDMAGADMAGDHSLVLDGGAPADMRAADPHAGMRCVERAGLFSCAFVSSSGDKWGGVALLAVVVLVLFRGRRRTRRRD